MGLQEEIEKTRAEIRTDGYPISVGEWISIYEKGELDIHPEFQRFFRWSPSQKSRLIESLLLGIPVPEVFVSQRPDGIWDVVDGLQRLSTIFEFVGVLKNEAGELLPPLVLTRTPYLPSLESCRWEGEEHALSPSHRLMLKRSKIGASIILKESDKRAKFDLFERLNTGGSLLSDQELRNSILVMLNRVFYQWLRGLADNAEFVSCIGLSDRQVEEQYDMELALRFIVFRRLPAQSITNLGDLGDFLTSEAKRHAQDASFSYQAEEEAFRETFGILAKTLADDAFRRYDRGKTRFLGGFSVSAFEAVAIGIGYDPSISTGAPNLIGGKVRQMWYDPEFTSNSGSGIRASSRLPKTIAYGRRVFSA